eukprot:7107990-Pyramimonas_sp.AAC.1
MREGRASGVGLGVVGVGFWWSQGVVWREGQRGVRVLSPQGGMGRGARTENETAYNQLGRIPKKYGLNPSRLGPITTTCSLNGFLEAP